MKFLGIWVKLESTTIASNLERRESYVLSHLQISSLFVRVGICYEIRKGNKGGKKDSEESRRDRKDESSQGGESTEWRERGRRESVKTKFV